MNSIVVKIASVAVSLILLTLLFQGCERVSKHEQALTACIADKNATGENILPSLLELENVLIQQNWLKSANRDDYSYLLRRITSGQISIPTQSVAPEVRDFWFLTSPASVSSYLDCISQLSKTFSDQTAVSIHQMNRIYQSYREADTQTEAANLAASITREDFDSILYRGALLMEIIRHMD